MDTYRGNFVDRDDDSGDFAEHDANDDVIDRQLPPPGIGQDERRMQVRAYNHWASLLDNRNFPSIEDLEPESLADFGPFSVLLDFTEGLENPSIRYLGAELAAECDTETSIETLGDVPSRSLLSRITDHYMQILANQAPIGFEAEFVNQRERTILYRGILLPYSSDDETIDFIYGVINWKELADQKTTDELLLEIDQALEAPAAAPQRRMDEMVDWADGPPEIHDEAFDSDREVLDLGGFDDAQRPLLGDLPAPSFGSAWDAITASEADAYDTGAGFADDGEAALEPAEIDPAGMELADWLAAARELAEAARGSEDRTRQALYAAIGRAYDFSLAAAAAPEEFDELVADSGLTVQERAPMTPVVKLVFGADYDKTRLTEYASALSHAHRIGLAQGELARYLNSAPGGLKGVINEERRLRREETGKPAVQRDTPREALARKLRKLEIYPFEAVPADGSEFTLLVARRLPSGEVVLLGEVGDDVALLERAARRLLD